MMKVGSTGGRRMGRGGRGEGGSEVVAGEEGIEVRGYRGCEIEKACQQQNGPHPSWQLITRSQLLVNFSPSR